MITPNFDARTDHLKVEENDVVTAINRTSDGLLWVQFQGKEGWIPETHLEKAITDKGMNNIVTNGLNVFIIKLQLFKLSKLCGFLLHVLITLFLYDKYMNTTT